MGKANSTPVGLFFPFHDASPADDLVKLLAVTPPLAPRLLAAVMALAMCDTSIRPFRLCACGCGESVHGKALCASPACRKRLEREKRRKQGWPGRQFNLVMQDELLMRTWVCFWLVGYFNQ